MRAAGLGRVEGKIYDCNIKLDIILLCYNDMINIKLWTTFTFLNKYYIITVVVFDKRWEPAVTVTLSLSVTVSVSLSVSDCDCDLWPHIMMPMDRSYGLTL